MLSTKTKVLHKKKQNIFYNYCVDQNVNLQIEIKVKSS